MKKIILPKNILENEYIIKRNSINKIVKKYGWSYSTVRRNLKRYDIKIRTISEANSGIYSYMYKKHHTKETKEKISISNSGPNHFFYGKKRPEHSKKMSGDKCHFYIDGRSKIVPKCIKCGKIISDRRYKHCQDCYLEFLSCSENNCMYKKHHSEESKKKIRNSDYHKNMKGENAPNYIDGRSAKPYTLEFSDKLKKQIRKRDNYTCQKCGMTQEEHKLLWKKALHVHHIDFDKKNCSEDNLITLCCKCNSEVNFNRDYWQEYFNNIMEKNYGKLNI